MKKRVEWFEKQGKQYGGFYFGKEITKADTHRLIEDWKFGLELQPQQKFILIWDFTEVIDYGRTAAILLQEVLEETDPQIDKLWLLTDLGMTRTAVSLIKFFEVLNSNMEVSKADIFEISELFSSSDPVLLYDSYHESRNKMD